MEFEVWQALSDLAGDKSPGPDGFPIQFYKLYWFFMKRDIMRIFNSFSKTGFLDWRLNSTFISLIPKEPGASSIKDFRPIALFSGCYKIVANVLANWLKPILPSLVSELQGTTVKGRQIQDLSYMVNKLLNSRFLSKTGGLMFKD